MIIKTISLFLVVVYSAVVFQPAFKYAAFKINQQYIVKNLCVEKDNVDNSCLGSCYLSNEMLEDSNESKNKTVPNKIEITELHLEFLIFSKSNYIQYYSANSYNNYSAIITIQKVYKPLVPPPKC